MSSRPLDKNDELMAMVKDMVEKLSVSVDLPEFVGPYHDRRNPAYDKSRAWNAALASFAANIATRMSSLPLESSQTPSKTLDTVGQVSSVRDGERQALAAPSVEHLDQLEKLAADTRALMNSADQRVVCAACKWPDGVVVTGIRHFSPDMRLTAARMGRSPVGRVEGGFVDQWGNWLTRQEAYEIAERQGQYRPYEPFTPGTLYSEDLY